LEFNPEAVGSRRKTRDHPSLERLDAEFGRKIEGGRLKVRKLYFQADVGVHSENIDDNKLFFIS